jgi:thiamine pyrophosphate-dependent acetolactate synthase large subunit-like protein
VKLAEAFGGRGVKMKDLDDLGDAIRRLCGRSVG